MTNTATNLLLTEIIEGKGLGLGAAARLLPAHRGDGRTSPSTLWRWSRIGTLTVDGRTVRLEAVRVGGRWLTSAGALARYMDALTPRAPPDDTAPPSQTRSEHQHQHQQASIGAVTKLIDSGF